MAAMAAIFARDLKPWENEHFWPTSLFGKRTSRKLARKPVFHSGFFRWATLHDIRWFPAQINQFRCAFREVRGVETSHFTSEKCNSWRYIFPFQSCKQGSNSQWSGPECPPFCHMKLLIATSASTNVHSNHSWYKMCCPLKSLKLQGLQN